MNRKIIVSVSLLVLSVLVCALFIIPKAVSTAHADSQERISETVKFKRGWYCGKSVDQGIKSMGIDTIQQKFVLHFTQPYDSLFLSGCYTVEGDRLKAFNRQDELVCTFKIEKDGTLVLLEAESPYFEKKPSPFFAEFEDGTVFSFSEAMVPGMNFGF